MALDVNKFRQRADEYVANAQQVQEPEETSFFQELGSVVQNASNIQMQTAREESEIAGNIAGGVYNIASNTLADINDAYSNFLDAQSNLNMAYSNAGLMQSLIEGDFSRQIEANEDIPEVGRAATNLLYSPVKATTRAIVNNYADDETSVFQDLAQGLQESNAYVNYMMTDEEKLQKAIEIEQETGLNAKEFMTDSTAFRQAIEIYNFAEKKKALGGDMNDVFEEFPELKNIASMDPKEAALALHDMNSVRETQGIIESFNKMFEYGNKRLEYDNIQYKIMTGEATEDDRLRADELKKELEKVPNLPSMLDDPLSAMAGGVAGSLPMMIQSFGEMANDFAVGASAGMVAGAAAGSAVPVVGTVGGGVAGAITGGAANTLRGIAMRQGILKGARLLGGYGARLGMFEGMRQPVTGGYFAEFKDMKGADGKPLLTDEAAQDYAVVAGALNAGIEMLDFGMIKNAVTGNAAQKTIKEIIATAQQRALARESIKSFFVNRASAIGKVTLAESGEEGLQSISDDLVRNQIASDTGDTSIRSYTATEIAQRALLSVGEALPGALGFGVISAGAGGIHESIGFSCSLKRLMTDNAKMEQNTRQTFAGTLMLEQLQKVVQNSKLKNTAPKVQEKLIRQQLEGTGFEMAYVDIPTALEKETGKEDLQKLAKVAGYSDKDLQTAIEVNGTLAVPMASFAQAETTSDIMTAVTFNQEAEPIGKISKQARQITQEMQTAIQKTADRQIKLIDGIINENLANSTDEQKTMAKAVIYENAENPRKGWRSIYDKQLAERESILLPAIEAVKKSIAQNDSWYRDFYAENKRAMTDKEIEDMAYKLANGDESAPVIPTWQAKTPQAQQLLQENRQALQDIDSNIKNLESIRDQMKELTGLEMRLVEGMSKEGYSVYKKISRQLANVGGKVKNASRMSAVLFARHADIVADIMRRNGNENYTAMTYYNERFALNTNTKSQENTADIKGSIDLLSNGQRVVNLFKSADESTFVHEMAHMFLMDLEELAKIDAISAKELATVNNWAAWNETAYRDYKGTAWAREFKRRHDSIINAQNAGDIETAERLKAEWRQERFARAFEQYLKKGNAPSRGLREVFRKFKDFLREIYVGFLSVGGSASASVEKVMARMVATEEEINQAALDDRYRDLTKAGGEKLLTETEEQTYERWHEEATAEAKEKLLAIVMKDLEADVQRQIENRIAAERVRKENELSNQPVYLAYEAVQQSHDENIVLEWYESVEAYKEDLRNHVPLNKAVDDYIKQYEKELDKELRESYFSDENIARAMESTPYHAKMVALEAKAFARKERLVNRIDSKTKAALQEVEDRISELPEEIDLKMDKDDEAVKNLLQAVNKLRFSAKWTARDFQEIENIIRSNTKEEIKKAVEDFRIKAEAVQKENEINSRAIDEAFEDRLKMFRELAVDSLKDKPIHIAWNAIGYRKDEKRHARNVQTAKQTKNWQRALREKEAQFTAAALAEQAEKNRNHITNLIKKIDKQLKTRSIKLPAQERYWHKHLAYILGLTAQDANPPVEGITPLADMFKSLQDTLDLEYSPTDILEIAGRPDFAGYQSLTMGEFEDAVQALDILYTTGRDRFKLKSFKGKEIQDAIDEIKLDLTAFNGARVKAKKVNPDVGGLGYNDIIGKVPGVGEAIARGGTKYLSTIMKPELIINMLGKKAHQYIYETFERASNMEARMQSENIAAIKSMLKWYSHKEKVDWKNEQYKLKFEDGSTEMLSKENIICMALNLGNEINKSRLVMGFGLEENYLTDFINKHMQKKDWELVQNIWDHLNTYWAQTVKVEQDLNGVTLKPQQPTPFDVTLPDGEILHMKGGYYPIVANPLKSARVNDQDVNEAVRRGMSGAQVFGTGRGFTKARSKVNLDRMLYLKFDVIPDHLSNVIHNITHRIAARDVYRIINNSEFMNYVNETLGREYYAVLKEWAEDNWKIIETRDNQAAGKIANVLRYLRTNSTLAIMGYRIYPVIENITNIAPMMDKLGAINAIGAIGDYYAHIGEYKELLHKSIFMRNRINNMDRDMKYLPGMFKEDGRITGFLKEHAYTFMTWSDLMLSMPLWCRAYRDAYIGKVVDVRQENENNKKNLANAQAKVQEIRARIYDLSQRRDKLDSQSAFDVQGEAVNNLSDVNTVRERVNITEEIKKLNHDLYLADVELDKASEVVLLTEKEILAEAEQRSILEADKAVRDVFGSGQTKDLASIQKGNELLKLFTPFYSFFNTQANAILEAYYRGKYVKGSDVNAFTRWMPLAKSFLYRIILTSALSTMLKMVLLGDGSDDKKKFETVKKADGTEEKVEIPILQRFLTQFGKNTLSTMTGTLAGVRDIATYFINQSFDGTDYGRGMNISNVAFAGGDKIAAFYKAIANKTEKDMEIAEREAKWQEEYAKASAKKKQKMLDDKQYAKPPKRITWADIAKAGGEVGTTFFAARTGITSTMANSVMTTMQYLADGDGRYDTNLKNIIWSAIFNKKPVEREIPEKPKQPKKKKSRNVRRY